MKTKTKKKVFIPNYAPWIRVACLLSGHNSCSGGHIHCLAKRDGNLWCGSRFLPTNSGMKSKKKVLGAKSQQHFGGGTGPEKHSSGSEPVTFLGAQSSLGEHISRLAGVGPEIFPLVVPGLQRKDVLVFESSCHLPTCLPHMAEASYCPFNFGSGLGLKLSKCLA